MTLKRRLRNIFIRLFIKLPLVLGAIGFVGFIIWSEVTYRNGLTFLPQNAAPTQQHHNRQLLHIQWTALGGQGVIPQDRGFSSHMPMLTRIAYHAINKTPPKAKATTDKVTLFTARVLLARRSDFLSQAKYHQAIAASAGWIDENWTIEQRLNTVLTESRNGLGCIGITKLAHQLLGKKTEKLSAEEATLLVSLQTLPFSYLKRSHRILKRTNRLIAGLKKNYPKLYGDSRPFTVLPFQTTDLIRVRRNCS